MSVWCNKLLSLFSPKCKFSAGRLKPDSSRNHHLSQSLGVPLHRREKLPEQLVPWVLFSNEKKNLNTAVISAPHAKRDSLNKDAGVWTPWRVVLNGPRKYSRARWQCPEDWESAFKGSFPLAAFQALLYHPGDTLRGNAKVAQMH